jgi:hypothetical protein
MKNGGSKIGTGALKKQPSSGTRVPSGQGPRKLPEEGSPSNKKAIGQGKVLQNLRAVNNNSNTSTNENSLPPKGHNKITAGGTSD